MGVCAVSPASLASPVTLIIYLKTTSDVCCRLDEHWRPASLYCSVCSGFQYNTILHFENIEAEEPHLADSLHAGDIIQPRYMFLNVEHVYYCGDVDSDYLILRWENKNSKEKESKEEVLEAYFSLLTEEEILKLYKIYEGDFVNFGYKFTYRTLKLG